MKLNNTLQVEIYKCNLCNRILCNKDMCDSDMCWHCIDEINAKPGDEETND